MQASITTANDRTLQIVEDQPADSSYDEILHELALGRMVDRGLTDSDAGRTVDHAEVKRRIESWAESTG